MTPYIRYGNIFIVTLCLLMLALAAFLPRKSGPIPPETRL
jgi:hypothetical protein